MDKKKKKGSTLIYDATDERYLRTDIYMSEDPADTVDLCVVDDAHPKFSDNEIDDSSGPWRRIIEPKKEPPAEEPSANKHEPLVLEEKHRKNKPVRRRTPTKVLQDGRSSSEKKKRSPDKPVWVRFEAEVLSDDGLLRVPERLHLLAKATGDRVDVRMRLMPSQDSGSASDTLDGLPTIGRD